MLRNLVRQRRDSREESPAMEVSLGHVEHRFSALTGLLRAQAS
jgi:hypothetical protein